MPRTLSSLKIALVHDYLREFGGAERVLIALHDMFPNAPVYVAFKDEEAMGKDWSRFQDWKIRETQLTHLPFYKQLFSPMRIFAAQAFAMLDLSEYDLVISSSNAYFAKAVQVPNGKQLCYCHTPPRVLYGYTAKSNWRQNPITLLAGQVLNHFARQIDLAASQQVDLFVANSQETARRIKKFYHRESKVVPPPVASVDESNTFFTQFNEKSWQQYQAKKDNSYYLYVNRLALAKHPEIAVKAAQELNLPLKVVGSGAMLGDLQKMAGPATEFLGAVDDATLAELYRGAKALLYPVEDEDFGIVPVEAMAWGTPVLAHFSGGPKETVLSGKTGLFFEQLTVASLSQTVQVLAKQRFSAQEIHQQMQIYSQTNFINLLKKIISDMI